MRNDLFRLFSAAPGDRSPKVFALLTSAARRAQVLSAALCSVAVLAAGLPHMADATDGPALTGLVATAEDAVTAVTNPAGLTQLHQTEWVSGIRAFYASSDFTTTSHLRSFPNRSVRSWLEPGR
jgi:hypothetical protein